MDNKMDNKKVVEEEYSNPQAVPLIVDVEEIKIPKDPVDNRDELVEKGRLEDIVEYGRPRLDLSREEIEADQLKDDDENLRIIEESFQKGEIDAETRDFLHDYYQNGTEIFAAFKESVNNLLGSQPKSKHYINLFTGRIDEKTAYFDEHVGPKTTMVYEYEVEAPWRLENQIPGASPAHINIKLIMPMMKDVRRAIEKVKIGGKYDLERRKELSKLRPGQTPEEAGLDMAKLRTPIAKFKDAIRCTVLAPRYDDIDALFKLSLQRCLAQKSSRPSKYLDNNPKNYKAFYKNSKNYRDMKNYLYVSISDEIHNRYEKRGQGRRNHNFLAEVQYKTEIQFFEGDLLTHREYERVRKLQQEFYGLLTEGDKKVYNAKIYSRLLNIQQINRRTFSHYNMFVLQEMRNMEDMLSTAGVKPDADGTWPLCRRLLDKALLVRSSVALKKDSFNDSAAWVKDVYRRYQPQIDGKYLADIRSYKPFFKKSASR